MSEFFGLRVQSIADVALAKGFDDEHQAHKIIPYGNVDSGNSSTTPLAGDATFTGTTLDVTDAALIQVAVFSDVASATDGLSIQFSIDGTNWDFTDDYTVLASTGKIYSAQAAAKFLRVVYTNGSSAQSVFRLQTIIKHSNSKPSSHRVQDTISDDDDAELMAAVLKLRTAQNNYVSGTATNNGNFKVSLEEYNGVVATGGLPVTQKFPINDWHDARQAINVISSTYGDTVSIDAKQKSLLKFGINPNVGTGWSTIWYTGQDNANETYVADNTNSIDSISSSSGSDTVQITLEGHTMSGGNRTFVTQTVTLTGQTRAALTTPLNRVTRAFVSGGSTDHVGEIYVYENTTISSGKPTDTTKIHLTMPAFSVTASNSSQKASTSLSSVDYWILSSFHAGLQEKTANLFATVKLQIRTAGGVWRDADDPIVLTSGTSRNYRFDPYYVVPKNSDVRLLAQASAANTEVSGGIDGYLALVQ